MPKHAPPKPPHRRKRGTETFSPWCQGELDGLCGVYAVINAFRRLCPEIDEAFSRKLFKVMVRSILEDRKREYATIWGGIAWLSLEPAAKRARRYLREKLGIKLSFSRPAEQWTSPKIGQVWRCLTEADERNAVAILALGGLRSHWTVAIAASDRSVTLADSTDLTELKRSRCSIAERERCFTIDPECVLVIERRIE